ncbi:MAG: ABC transporter permease [Chitinophagaceae bacterium]
MNDIHLEHAAEEQKWDREVNAQNDLFDLHLNEVWNYRDLIMLFVWRDFVAQYKQTVLGPVWQFVQPALTTFVFLLLFNKIAKLPTDGIAPVVFYLSGITLWNYFSNCLVTISNTFVNNAYIFGKVYFPRLVLPISLVISNMVKFGLQFLLVVVVMIYYHFNGYPLQIGFRLLLMPLLLVQMAALGLGLGLIISSITTKYRDFSVLLAFAVQLIMYATPVVFPLSYVDDHRYRFFININPLTSIIESFRLVLLNRGTVEMYGVFYSIGFTIVTLIIGMIFFNKVGKTFIDTV